jgi:hypothetical protein
MQRSAAPNQSRCGDSADRPAAEGFEHFLAMVRKAVFGMVAERFVDRYRRAAAANADQVDLARGGVVA